MRFFFFPHNSENGYGIRVSGTAVSQHWGKVLLSFFLLYHGNSFIIYLLHAYLIFNFSTGSLPHLALRVSFVSVTY